MKRKCVWEVANQNNFSFIPHSYKTGLICTLVDRIYKINNTWKGFDIDLKRLFSTLGKNQFPSHIIDKVVRSYLDNKVYSRGTTDLETLNTRYYKLPYIGNFSCLTQAKVRHLIKTYCKNIDVKLVFTSFKARNMFVNKDLIPLSLRSHVVYKFNCTSCNACYIGETHRHFSTRINEHLRTDKNSHIFKHLAKSHNCKSQCDHNSFKIIDRAPTKLQLRIKESLHISWNTPNLNRQVESPFITLLG